MCGIAGLSLVKSEGGSPTAAAIAMLRAIEHRGPDATGAAWVSPDGDVLLQKEAISAARFVRAFSLNGGRTAILHTRWATKGSPKNPLNNHPIDVAGIVGVHNGQLRNDDALFDLLDMPRYGEVDSEAAFALLNFSDEMSVCDRLSLIEGTAALAWLSVDDEGKSDRVLHLARVNYSPLWIGQTQAGSTLFASTQGAVSAGAKALGAELPFLHQVQEGTYLRVKRGIITEFAAIPAMTPVKGVRK